MSRSIVISLSKQFRRVSKFYDQFIDACPDKLWSAIVGGFPVWLNVYHALDCIPFFLAGKGELCPVRSLHPHEVVFFKRLDVEPTSRAEMKEFARCMNEYAKIRFGEVCDADLGRKHEGFCSRANVDSDYGLVLSGVIGHHFYHFGMCDTVLRDNGLEGVF